MNNLVILYQTGTHLNQFSNDSWKKYCDIHKLKLLTLCEIINPKFDRLNQIFYIFQTLRYSDIEFDNICLVNDTTLIKNTTGNLFELTNDKLTFAEWDSDFNYLLTNMELYQQHFFDNKKVDFSRFFDFGMFMINKSHENIFNMILDFLNKNYTNLHNQLDLTFVPQNFFFDCEYNKLPYSYNMIDINRKELPIDKNLSKFGYIFNFRTNPESIELASTFL